MSTKKNIKVPTSVGLSKDVSDVVRRYFAASKWGSFSAFVESQTLKEFSRHQDFMRTLGIKIPEGAQSSK